MAAPHLPQVEPQQIEVHQGCGKRLGAGHADLWAGVHVDHAVGQAGGLAAHHVDDGPQQGAFGLRLLHGRQRVHRLAALGDGQHRGPLINERIAVAELGAIVHLHRDTGQGLDEELAHQPGIGRGAAGHDDDLFDLLRLLRRSGSALPDAPASPQSPPGR